MMPQSNIIINKKCQVWWYTPIIPALRRLRQEDHKFKASLDYKERHYPKNKIKQENEIKQN
jgi:hypothetical protein